MDITSYMLGKKSGGGQPPTPVDIKEKDVNFYDYDGTLLYSYTLQEAQALTQLPSGPTHEGLVFEDWNWTLADIKTKNNKVDVGALYNTTDGTTKIHISLTVKEQLNVTSGFLLNGTAPYSVYIDWGDGSDPTKITNNSANHVYNSLGDYIITITPDANTQFIRLLGNTGAGTRLLYHNYNYRLTNSAIKKIYIGDKIDISSSCFEGASGLETITFSKNTTVTSQSGLFTNCHSLKFLVLPKSITGMPSSFCSSCYRLKGVCLPKEIISMGDYAFAYTYNLEKIVIPTLTSVTGTNHFTNSGIRKAYVYTPNGATVFPSFGGSNIEEINVPNGYTELQSGGFSKCDNLKNIIFNSNTLTTIQNGCFKEGNGLESITLPNSVTEIKDQAFKSALNLVEINLGNSLQTIGGSAFASTYYLKKIKFPSTLTTINGDAFGSCYAIRFDFSDCLQIPTLASSNVFSSLQTSAKIIVPDALYDDWIVAQYWSNFASRIIKASEA